jgi:hypothetical protein
MEGALFMSNVIYKAEKLWGIKYWALHRPGVRIEVYRYVGYNPDNGHHFFQAMRCARAILRFSNYQVFEQGLKPFVIDGDLALSDEESRQLNQIKYGRI